MALPKRRVEGLAPAPATLVTRVRVRPDDPSFANPTKFVGPFYAEAQIRALARERGWRVARAADGWRRVVPSPEPVEVLNAPALLAALRFAEGAGRPAHIGEIGRLEAVLRGEAGTVVLP